ncbi:MAG: hypothetical protein MI723_11400 [Caulobacterales bacterium]|nr:hypothetical protein [Caulobacterales bacterium]
MTACESNGAPVQAALASADADSLAALEAGLARAMKRARVTLGPGDLTQSSTVSVLPPAPGPLEGRSPARPVLFDLVLKGRDCIAVRRDTGEEHRLAGLDCRALES